MDKIHLKKLEVDCIIGIFRRERVKKQRVWIDLEVPCDARRAALSDRVEDTVDYKRISKAVLRFVEASRFKLIETLAERVAALVLEHGPRSVKVTVWKPGAVRFSKNVGVTIERESPRRDETAYVSFGSNVRKEASTRAAIKALREAFYVMELSGVYESDPVGSSGSKFWNFVAGIRTALPPEALRKKFREIEAKLGRVRSKDKYAPRTADLDIIFYRDEEPHADWHLPHVLLPMAEIAPNFVHPELGRTIVELVASQLGLPAFRKVSRK